jgi:hypothetical protein
MENNYFSKSNQFLAKTDGNCLDSDSSPLRVKDGDFVFVHPLKIETWSIIANVGKLIIFHLKNGKAYIKKLIQVIDLDRQLIKVCFYNPEYTELFFRLDDIDLMYIVDSVAPKDVVSQ